MIHKTRMSDTEVCVNPNQMQDFQLMILCRYQVQVVPTKSMHLGMLDLERH